MKARLVVLAVLSCVLQGACRDQVRCIPDLITGDHADNGRTVVERFLRASQSGDADTLRAVLAPDAHLTLPVAGVYSPSLHAFPEGTHWDGEGVVEREADLHRKLIGVSSLEIVSLIGEGDSFAAEVVEHGVWASNRRLFIQHFSYHFRIRYGRVSEIRLYQDTLMLWDLQDNPGLAVTPSLPTTKQASSIAIGNENKSVLRSDVSDTDHSGNKDVVRRFFIAVQARDFDAVRAAWAADGIWSSAIGGDYSPELRAFTGASGRSREAMIELIQNGTRNLREPLTLDIYSIIAEGDQVSAEAVGYDIRSNGRAYRQHYSFHFKVLKGKLVECHEYQDTLHAWDLMHNVGGEPPVAVRLSAP